MHSLGHKFDIGLTCPPAATNGAVTGKRVSLADAGGCTFILVGGVATAGDDLQVDVQQHTAGGAAGTSKDLDTITAYHYKSAVAMDNTETWTTVTQTAASEIAVAAAATTDIQQNILVVEVDAADLDDGYTHISLNVPDLGTGDKTLAVLCLLTDLHVKRAPANMKAVG